MDAEVESVGVNQVGVQLRRKVGEVALLLRHVQFTGSGFKSESGVGQKE